MGALAAVLANARPDVRIIKRMTAAAPHRGTNVEVVVVGRCALGRQMEVTREDASVAAEDGFAAAFTGDLDNHTELSRQLQLKGTPSTPRSPSRLLLALFRVYGDRTPGMLRGTFAAMLTDGQQLWSFRDQLGLRPLFFRHEAGGLYVASEAKQVVAGSAIPLEPDLETVHRMFYDMVDERTPSALRGVSRIPPATVLRGDGRTVSLQRYWSPEGLLETERLSEEEVQAGFERLMTQAVARSVTGHDVIALSGGIDSPAVAAYAAPEHLNASGRPIMALSAVYPEFPTIDERRYIEEVTRHLGTPLHTYRPQTHPMVGLTEWVRILDGPVPMTVNSLPEAEERCTQARALGFRCMLTGDLAEAVFHLRGNIIGHLFARGRMSALWRQVRSQRSEGVPVGRLGRQLISAFLPRRLAQTYMRVRHRPEIPNWLEPGRLREAAAQSVVSGGRRWQAEQLQPFTRPELALEADEICQARSGVRVRRPWADLDLWEFFLRLPAEVKFPSARRKALVCRLLRGRVPQALLDRSDKTYFDDFVMSRVDYAALHRWLVRPSHRITGVRYDLLAERIEAKSMQPVEFMWAKGLAGVHAFLSRWD